MAFLGIDTTKNLSLYAIPAAWGLAMAPHGYAMYLYSANRAPGTPDWDFCAPKKTVANVKEGKLSPRLQERFLRAEAANDNQFIGLPFFAAAMVAGNVARIPANALNTAAGLYLAGRIAYTFLYVTQTTRIGGFARTASWLTCMITCMTVFVQAGNRLYDGPRVTF